MPDISQAQVDALLSGTEDTEPSFEQIEKDLLSGEKETQESNDQTAATKEVAPSAPEPRPQYDPALTQILSTLAEQQAALTHLLSQTQARGREVEVPKRPDPADDLFGYLQWLENENKALQRSLEGRLQAQERTVQSLPVEHRATYLQGVIANAIGTAVQGTPLASDPDATDVIVALMQRDPSLSAASTPDAFMTSAKRAVTKWLGPRMTPRAPIKGLAQEHSAQESSNVRQLNSRRIDEILADPGKADALFKYSIAQAGDMLMGR